MWDQVFTSTVQWVVPFVLGGGIAWLSVMRRDHRTVRDDVSDIRSLLRGREAKGVMPAQPGLIEVVGDLAQTLRENSLTGMRDMLHEHARRLDEHTATLAKHGARLDLLDPAGAPHP